ncbi:MAG: molecular chaperone HtpG [Oscillospiraceae bacterium]|nr:molecular chaperone HtpG [Oscillospiraceae bacterium]
MRKKQFKTESKRILDLMINSIYTNKEIFLRELISNASDAMDKLYFVASAEGGKGFDRSDFEIRIEVDQENRSLSIIDNGIGMSQSELESNLGTIARSGTLDFRNDNKAELERERTITSDYPEDEAVDVDADNQQEIDIIGQFGVGFYSSFMVSKTITVISRAYGSETTCMWYSEGADGYTVTELENDQRNEHGTTVTLILRDDIGEEDYSTYLDEYTLKRIVKKYSDYIRYPIRMSVTRTRPIENEDADSDTPPEYESYTEIETLNSMVPLWRRNKNELSEEDYQQFYQDKFHDYEPSLTYTHFNAEGLVSFSGIMYIPGRAPYGYYSKEYEKGLQLYSNGVLIMDRCADLLPDCFSFVKGLVDSPDLSLNISREILQQSSQLQLIAKNLDRRIKNELMNLQENDREKYEEFFKNFGLQIKFGIYNSFGADSEKLQDLLLYHSLKEDKMVTLAEYQESMPEDQKEIYYAAGGSISRIRQLPQAELILDNGYDILALTEDIDEFAMKMIRQYKEKEIKSVSDSDLDLETDIEKEVSKEQAKLHEDLFTALKDALDDKVKEVRLSTRLKSHPVWITSDGPLSLEMEKVLSAMPMDGQPKAERVLEINGNHPVFQVLVNLAEADQDKLSMYAQLLYNQALLIEGLPIEDPVSFANDICELMI